MIQLDIWSRTKNPTLTPSVVRNPTPPKNLRLLLRNPGTVVSHMQLLNSYCFKKMTFLTVYNQWLLQKSLIPHKVKCPTEPVNNLSRPLETCKMLKIILPKLKLIKISESVIPLEYPFQHQLGFAVHLTWNVTNVTFIFSTSPNTKPKEKNVGGHSMIRPPRLKKFRGTRPLCPPPNCTHAPRAHPCYATCGTCVCLYA